MGELTDFLTFKPFNDLRKKMGATQLGDFTLIISKDHVSPEEEKALENQGIEIESLDEIQEFPDGTLVYKNRRVIVYIRDINTGFSSGFNLSRFHSAGLNKESNLPKFHISWCRTLKEMKAKNRYERYVISTREDGDFEVRNNGVSSWKKLKVCKNCLDRLKYQNYSSHRKDKKNKIYENFTLKEFFIQYPNSPLESAPQPRHTDVSAPTNDYPKDWDQIAKAYKEQCGWKCEECKVDLGKDNSRRYLHVHHISAAKYNNTPSNLKALCIACHAEQPQHQHMKSKPDYKKFIDLKSKGWLDF